MPTVKPLVIGLDSSTTGTKAMAFDRQGNVSACATDRISLHSPRPNHYEQNPDDWWVSAQNVLRKITRRIRPERIAALAIANQRETFVPVDSKGVPLRPAIIWLDERCRDMVKPFSEKIGVRKIHRISGKPADYAPVVYRLAWMKTHEPELFGRISRIYDVHTWLVDKLTGTFQTSWASADPLGMFDMKRKRWSPVILQALTLNEKHLPETVPPGSIIGKISRKAAVKTGLNAGTPVAAGGGDGQAAGLGANAVSTERAYLNLGTAVVAGVFGQRYRISPAFRTMSACAESGYYYECSLRAGTFAVDWLVTHILKADPVKTPGIYRVLEKEARQTPPGSDGLLFLPYLCGAMNPWWDVNARGAFTGLSASHDRGHLYRAVLEGIAFEQRFALREVEKAIRNEVREIAVIGGGAASTFWCRILADITGRPVLLPVNTEASALGAGITAAVCAGWYPSFHDAAAEMTAVRETVTPDPQSRNRYDRCFDAYTKLYTATAAIYAGMR